MKNKSHSSMITIGRILVVFLILFNANVPIIQAAGIEARTALTRNTQLWQTVIYDNVTYQIWLVLDPELPAPQANLPLEYAQHYDAVESIYVTQNGIRVDDPTLEFRVMFIAQNHLKYLDISAWQGISTALDSTGDGEQIWIVENGKSIPLYIPKGLNTDNSPNSHRDNVIFALQDEDTRVELYKTLFNKVIFPGIENPDVYTIEENFGEELGFFYNMAISVADNGVGGIVNRTEVPRTWLKFFVEELEQLMWDQILLYDIAPSSLVCMGNVLHGLSSIVGDLTIAIELAGITDEGLIALSRYLTSIIYIQGMGHERLEALKWFIDSYPNDDYKDPAIALAFQSIEYDLKQLVDPLSILGDVVQAVWIPFFNEIFAKYSPDAVSTWTDIVSLVITVAIPPPAGPLIGLAWTVGTGIVWYLDWLYDTPKVIAQAGLALTIEKMMSETLLVEFDSHADNPNEDLLKVRNLMLTVNHRFYTGSLFYQILRTRYGTGGDQINQFFLPEYSPSLTLAKEMILFNSFYFSLPLGYMENRNLWMGQRTRGPAITNIVPVNVTDYNVGDIIPIRVEFVANTAVDQVECKYINLDNFDQQDIISTDTSSSDGWGCDWNTINFPANLYAILVSVTDEMGSSRYIQTAIRLIGDDLPVISNIVVTPNQPQYDPGETVSLSVNVRDDDNITVTDATLSGNIDGMAFGCNAGGFLCTESGNGNYTVSFAAPSAIRQYPIQITVSKTGYLSGVGSSSITVYAPYELGHDAELTFLEAEKLSSQVRVQANTQNIGTYIGTGLETIRINFSLKDPNGIVVDTDNSQTFNLTKNSIGYSTWIYLSDPGGFEDGQYIVDAEAEIVGQTDQDGSNNQKSQSLWYGTRPSYSEYGLRQTSAIEGGISSPVIDGYTIEAVMIYSDDDDSYARINVYNNGASVSDCQLKRINLNEIITCDNNNLAIIMFVIGHSTTLDAYFYLGKANNSGVSFTPGTSVTPAGLDAYFHVTGPSGVDLNDFAVEYDAVNDDFPVVSAWDLTDDRNQDNDWDVYFEVPSSTSPETYDFWLAFEDNNSDFYKIIKKLAIEVKPPHNLMVSSIAPSEEIITVGSIVPVDIVVQNSGGYTEYGINLNIKITGPNSYLQTYNQVISSLSSGSSITRNVNWATSGLPAGTYYIEAEVPFSLDAYPSNNIITTYNVLSAPPNLNIDGSTNKTSYIQNENMTISSVVTSNGESLSDATVTYYVKNSTDQTISSGQLISQGSGVYSVNIQAPMSIGVFSISFSAAKAGYINGNDLLTGINVDMASPDTYIVSSEPMEGELVNYNDLEFEWNGFDLNAASNQIEYSYKLDANPWSTYSTSRSITLSDISEGSHTFFVKARVIDGMEDPTPASRSFIIDTTAPIFDTNPILQTNIYKNSEIIVIQVDLDDSAIINASFLAIDSGFNYNNVTITETDLINHIYQVSYPITQTNSRLDNEFMIRISATDSAGNFTLSQVFVVLDNDLPVIEAMSPENGTMVSIDTGVSIAFSEPMNVSLTENAFTMSPDVEGSFSWNGNSLYFTPGISLLCGMEYSVQLTSSASDLAGNNLVPAAWSFSTINCNGPEMDVQGNGVSIEDGDNTPSTTDYTDFGTTSTSEGTVPRTFTIYNTGNGSLTLNGTPNVAVSGTNASDFTVSVLPTSPVAAGDSTTFTVVFDPSSTGVRTATISIANDDADEGSYTFNIQGTGIANPIPMITNLSPSSADAGGSAFTLTVNGSNFVADSKVRWNGTDRSTTYMSSTQLTASISAADIATAGTASVTVFNPTPGGGTSDEKIFTINQVVAYPEMDVKGNNISIPSGDTTPSISDHTEFDVAPVGGTAERTFTIFNTGNADLILSSSPVISFSGEHASDFSVKTSPNSLVVAGGSTTFTILFTPGAVGVRTATISIGNNDADENPYTFAIQGTGIGSPMPFGKINPNNNASNQLTDITLEWGNSSNATLYEYCIETDNDGDCDTIWRSAGMDNSAGVSGLSPLTTYYWQVRADNDYDPTEADGGVWWTFTTGNVTGQWINTTVLNTSRYLHAMTAWDNYVYVLGGEGSGALLLSSIERAPINSDGTLGTWVTIGNMTSARRSHRAVVADGYMYVVGGYGGTTSLNTVEYAAINPDGTLGSWQTTSSLVTARTNFGLVHYSNHLYAIDGSAGNTVLNSVEYAPILEDGSLGTWQPVTPTINARHAINAVLVDGYIYVPSGSNIDNGVLASVEYNQIQPDGALSNWQTTTAISGTWPARNYFSGLTDGKIVYVIGGSNALNNSVATTKTSIIKADHALDTWQDGANLIQHKFGMGSVSTKGSLYVSAGYGAGVTYLNTVEYYHSAYYVPVEADFSATPLSGIVPYDVAFTNQSSGAYDTCIWDYGDGTVSKDCFDPVHTYETPGVYTVTLTVQGLGDEDSLTQTGLISVFAPPEAANDSYSTDEDTPNTVAAPGVLDNDTDAESDPLTAIKVTDPAHGTLTLNSDGSFTYTPDANWSGTDSFTYKANDGTVDSNTATVTLTVNAVNDPPIVVGDNYTTDEDTSKTVAVPGVLDNDTDAESDPLTAIKVTDPAHGTLTLNADGSFTYTPDANWSGADSFTYKANDGTADSNTATVSINVTAVNDVPVANVQSVSTPEDAAKAITLTATDPDDTAFTWTIVSAPAHGSLSGTAPNVTYTPAANYSGADSFTFKVNDGDVDSNTATVSINVTAVNDVPVANAQSVSTAEDTAKAITLTVTDPDDTAFTWTIVTPPAHGALSGTAPNVTYTPTANWNGTDSFTFKVNDGDVNSNTATVSINVTTVNDPPVTVNDSAATNEDTPKTVAIPGVLGNDTDVDGNSLTAIKVTNPAHGTVTLNANGSFTYTPAANWNGTDSFTYKANDGMADSNVATVTLNVTAVNDPPVANGQSVSTPQGTPKAITLTAADVESNPLTWTIVANPAHGALSGTAPNVTYSPTAGWSGTDTFTFKVNDGVADSNVATISITVTPVNAPPVAVNDSTTTNEDTPKTVAAPGVLGNDTDTDSDPLTAIKVTDPAHGSVTLNTNGSFTYTPAANWNGTDSFTYKANDGMVDSNIATVTLNVTAVNDVPVANAQSVTTTEDTAKAITLTATDPDDTTFTWTIVATPVHGALSGTAPNVTYTPTTDYNGADSFTFKINDGDANSNTATVSITVSEINDSPVAVNNSYTAAEDTPKTVAVPGVLGNDTDVDGNSLTAIKVTNPAHGTVTLNTNGSFTYTPAANWNGTDSFTYKANDGMADSNVATVTLNVTAVNDPPVANGQSVSTAQGTPKAITLTAADVESNPLTWTIVANPAYGALSGTAPNVTYSPTAGWSGTDTFTFKVNDGTTDSNIANVTITVTPSNIPPVAVNDAYETNEDTILSITAPGVLGNDTDTNGDSLEAALVTGPSHGTLTLNSNGSFTYIPYENWFGTDSFMYTVYDGSDESNMATVTITVADVPESRPIYLPLIFR